MARKASEVAAEGGNLAARLDPQYTRITARQEGKPDISLTLRPLTYLEQVYVDSVKGRGLQVEREGNEVKSVSYNPDSVAEFVQWTLRFGIESVEGAAWETDTIRVAGRSCSCVKLACLDALPPELLDAALTQIQSLSQLSDGERLKLDFTSPLHEEAGLSVTALSA